MSKIYVVAQIRVSSQKQVENTSLDFQEKAIVNFCRERGYTLLRIFREEGISGSSIFKRRDLMGALDYCHNLVNSRTPISKFITYKIDRFTRNIYDFTWFAQKLEEIGIHIESTLEEYANTIEGELSRNINAVIADSERKQTIRKLNNGHADTYRKGYWPNNPKLGYVKENVFSKTVRRCVKDPIKWPQVRIAWDMLLTGNYSQAQILAKMHEIGLTGKNGRLLTKQTLSTIFHSSFYAGCIEVKNIKSKYADFNIHVERGEHYDIRMIEIEDYFNAQEILNGKRVNKHMKYNTNNAEFSLNKVLRCRKCNRHMSGYMTSKGIGYYKCIKPTKEGHDHINAAKVENAILQSFNNFKMSEDFKNGFKEYLEIIYSTNTIELFELAKSYQTEIHLLEKQLIKIKELAKSDFYTPQEAIEERNSVESLLSSKRNLLAECTNNTDDIVQIIDQNIKDFEQLEAYYKRLSGPSKSQFLLMLFPQGLYFNEGQISNPEKEPAYEYIWQIKDAFNQMVKCLGHKSNFSISSKRMIEYTNWAEDFHMLIGN